MYLVPITDSTLHSHIEFIMVLQRVQNTFISFFCICFVILPEIVFKLDLTYYNFVTASAKKIIKRERFLGIKETTHLISRQSICQRYHVIIIYLPT